MGIPAVIGAEFGNRLVVSDQNLVATTRLTYDMCDSWPFVACRSVYKRYVLDLTPFLSIAAVTRTEF